ncbi:MAG: HlyD family efflux transporter periplasmic adaptor subunit [Chloroflexota bacterium]|nr:HlyD family efflux transporter periplasmic adaptor subunit [Chloroflexota bacterium]
MLLNRSVLRVAAASALLLLAAACGGGGERVFDGVVSVSRGDVVVTVSANATAHLADPRALRFGVAGTVASVEVEEGGRVEAGQALAKLETDALDLAALKADADLALAQETLGDLMAPPDPADVALAEAVVGDAERSLADAQTVLAAAAPKQTNAADAADTARVEALDAYAKVFRTYYGFQPGAGEMTDAPDLILQRRGNPGLLAYYTSGLFPVEVRQSDVDDALATAWELVRAADRAYAEAMLALESAQTAAARAVTQARQALRAAEERLAALNEPPSVAAVLKAEAALATAQFAADTTRANRDAATLASPIAGVVVSLSIEPGDTVGVANVVAVVADPALLEVVVLVDGRDALLVREGQAAVVSARSAPLEAAPGRVSAVGLLPSGQGASARYPVTIVLDDAAALQLRPGMEAFASIEVERREDVVVVPLGAVQRDSRQFVVRKVAEDGLTDHQVVVLGAYDDFNAEIVRGVREGDVVVDFSTAVTQSNFLRDGRPLR